MRCLKLLGWLLERSSINVLPTAATSCRDIGEMNNGAMSKVVKVVKVVKEVSERRMR